MVDVGATALSWGQIILECIYYLILFLVVVGIIGGIWWFFTWLGQYKYRLRIRTVTGTKRIIEDDKVREFTKEGVTYWQRFRKPKHLLPLPPPEALDVDKKGRISAEAYLTGTDEYTYIKDTGPIEQFQPLTTKQRLVLVKQFERAATKKKTQWTDYIMPVAGGLMVLIIFVMCFAFWEDVTKPLLAAHQQSVEVSKQNAETATMLNQILQQKQVLDDGDKVKPPLGVPE